MISQQQSNDVVRRIENPILQVQVTISGLGHDE